MKKVKRGDKVVVIAGKDKCHEGIVLRVINSLTKYKNSQNMTRVVVEGVNLIKKHLKGNPSQGTSGGIIEKEASLHYSNVAIVNPSTGKSDKVGFKFLEDGRKVRFFKSNGEVIDV